MGGKGMGLSERMGRTKERAIGVRYGAAQIMRMDADGAHEVWARGRGKVLGFGWRVDWRRGV